MLGVVVLAACGSGGAVDGEMSAKVDEFDAAWTVKPTRCVSGEHAGFFGVDLLAGDDQGTLLRVVKDPIEGVSFGMNVPGTDRALFLDGTGCELFDVDVVRESSRVNNYWNVTGHALIDCSTRELELHVDIGFAGCH